MGGLAPTNPPACATGPDASAPVLSREGKGRGASFGVYKYTIVMTGKIIIMIITMIILIIIIIIIIRISLHNSCGNRVIVRMIIHSRILRRHWGRGLLKLP